MSLASWSSCRGRGAADGAGATCSPLGVAGCRPAGMSETGASKARATRTTWGALLIPRLGRGMAVPRSPPSSPPLPRVDEQENGAVPATPLGGGVGSGSEDDELCVARDCASLGSMAASATAFALVVAAARPSPPGPLRCFVWCSCGSSWGGSCSCCACSSCEGVGPKPFARAFIPGVDAPGDGVEGMAAESGATRRFCLGVLAPGADEDDDSHGLGSTFIC
mmetsp:Transcript_10842/g.27970  ORF Transcript_10842/g.27970 Transcript_10842/m.27970 type:complete len:222 (+) Transcript_10842:373-1038(+)